MLKQERLQIILNSLKKNQRVLLSDISKELHVSEDTARRDIKELSAQKLLKEVRGGAVPHAPGPHSFKERTQFAGRQKQLMAKKAIKLLRRGQVIILDSGTSALAVASILPKDLELTVMTNSFPIVSMLEDRQDVEVFTGGGRLFRESFMTIGEDAINFYRAIQADICFLGICSIDLQLGITGHHYEECAVKKAMIRAARQVIALSTPEKLNTAEAFHIAPIGALNGIVTSDASLDLLIPYKDAGITII